MTDELLDLLESFADRRERGWFTLTAADRAELRRLAALDPANARKIQHWFGAGFPYSPPLPKPAIALRYTPRPGPRPAFQSLALRRLGPLRRSTIAALN